MCAPLSRSFFLLHPLLVVNGLCSDCNAGVGVPAKSATGVCELDQMLATHPPNASLPAVEDVDFLIICSPDGISMAALNGAGVHLKSI